MVRNIRSPFTVNCYQKKTEPGEYSWQTELYARIENMGYVIIVICLKWNLVHAIFVVFLASILHWFISFRWTYVQLEHCDWLINFDPDLILLYHRCFECNEELSTHCNKKALAQSLDFLQKHSVKAASG